MMNGMDADFVGLVQGRAKQTGGFSAKDGYSLAGFIAKGVGSINETDHSINFVISSEVIDRQGEIVRSGAIARAIKDFGRNPVALAAHVHRSGDGSPTVVGSWDIGSFRKFKDHCEMRLRFAVDTKLGAEYWTLYSQGHMRAVSIGFRVIDAHEESLKSGRVHVIDELELIEISCVPVPACQDALAKSKERKRGFVAEKRLFGGRTLSQEEKLYARENGYTALDMLTLMEEYGSIAAMEQSAEEFALALLGDMPAWETEAAGGEAEEAELDIDLAALVAG